MGQREDPTKQNVDDKHKQVNKQPQWTVTLVHTALHALLCSLTGHRASDKATKSMQINFSLD